MPLTRNQVCYDRSRIGVLQKKRFNVCFFLAFLLFDSYFVSTNSQKPSYRPASAHEFEFSNYENMRFYMITENRSFFSATNDCKERFLGDLFAPKEPSIKGHIFRWMSILPSCK